MIKLNKKAVISLLAIASAALTWRLLDSPTTHDPRQFGPPAKTQWKPIGPRSAGKYDYDIIPEPITWHAIHVDVANADSVWGVVAPMFELDWVAEQAYFVGSGNI